MKNKLMEEALVRLNKSRELKLNIDANRLKDFLCGKIHQYKDMYILDFYKNCLSNAENELKGSRYMDDIEGSQSHFHMQDLVERTQKKFNSIEFFRLGLFVTELLFYRLKHEFPNDCFVILISFNINGRYRDCIVRFHKFREADNLYNQEYLEEFGSEAIGIILT